MLPLKLLSPLHHISTCSCTSFPLLAPWLSLISMVTVEKLMQDSGGEYCSNICERDCISLSLWDKLLFIFEFFRNSLVADPAAIPSPAGNATQRIGARISISPSIGGARGGGNSG